MAVLSIPLSAFHPGYQPRDSTHWQAACKCLVCILRRYTPVNAIRSYCNYQRYNALPCPVAFLYNGGKPLFPADAAYDITSRVDTQGGIWVFFNFFSAGENGGGVGIQHIYSPYWYNDARVYQSVCQLSIKSLSIFFLSEKFYTIPHPTYIPRAPSFHSTKILRYAIHAQYNYRGRECHTSRLICGWNSILWGLEARRARSLYLGEWLWG